MSGDYPCQFMGLVEVAFLYAGMMERDGDERPALRERLLEAGVVERFQGEGAEAVSKVDFPAVFEPVDKVERPRIPPEDRTCEFECEVDVGAVRAIESGIDAAVKTFSTRGAEGRVQTWQGIHTPDAQRDSARKPRAAERAFGWIKQIEKPCADSRGMKERDHDFSNVRSEGRPQNT